MCNFISFIGMVEPSSSVVSLQLDDNSYWIITLLTSVLKLIVIENMKDGVIWNKCVNTCIESFLIFSESYI